MLDNFYTNFLNFFYNPKSLKEIIEIKNYYKEKKLLNKEEVFKEIENANKVENINNNFVSA
jgi:hypothetical protein